MPGREVRVRPAARAGRKTAYDLILVRVAGHWVSLDARLPGPLFVEAVRAGRLPEFAGYPHIQQEVPLNGSRIDVLLEGPRGRCWVEAKSVTLVEEGAALFPDAVTARGRRHVETLLQAVRRGVRAAVVFVVQREDAAYFRPHDASDPAFGAALRRAAAAGVEVYAYTCRVNEREIVLQQRIPVVLEDAAASLAG